MLDQFHQKCSTFDALDTIQVNLGRFTCTIQGSPAHRICPSPKCVTVRERANGLYFVLHQSCKSQMQICYLLSIYSALLSVFLPPLLEYHTYNTKGVAHPQSMTGDAGHTLSTHSVVRDACEEGACMFTRDQGVSGHILLHYRVGNSLPPRLT